MAANEKRNADEGLVDVDIAEKYMKDHERREAEVRRLLEEAGTHFEQADKLTESAASDADHIFVTRLEVRGVRCQVEALLTSFQVGTPDPEDEPGGETQ